MLIYSRYVITVFHPTRDHYCLSAKIGELASSLVTTYPHTILILSETRHYNPTVPLESTNYDLGIRASNTNEPHALPISVQPNEK
jgi:hypothetical protein